MGAPATVERHAPVVEWMDRNSHRLFLSVVTVLEVADGIAKLHRAGASRKAVGLETWFGRLLHFYGSRILSLDRATALSAGALSDKARGLGIAPGFPDLVIAATAAVRGHVVLTRNLRHFEGLGVSSVDPLRGLPDD